jgi:hypothetical protein
MCWEHSPSLSVAVVLRIPRRPAHWIEQPPPGFGISGQKKIQGKFRINWKALEKLLKILKNKKCLKYRIKTREKL